MRSTARDAYDNALLRPRTYDGRPVVSAYDFMLVGRSAYFRVKEERSKADVESLLDAVQSIYSAYQDIPEEDYA